MTHEDFVTYEQAVKLKELRFDWKVNHSYYTIGCRDFHESLPTPACEPGPTDTAYSNLNELSVCVSAPTLAQAQKWLREVKGIHVWVESELNEYNSNIVYNFYIFDSNRRVYIGDCDKIMCQNTYEQALSASIDAALELLK